jgi:hypothetical protein
MVEMPSRASRARLLACVIVVLVVLPLVSLAKGAVTAPMQSTFVLNVQSSPITGVEITWSLGTGGQTQSTNFEIGPENSPFTVSSLTAPSSVTVGSITYSFSHWSLDGVNMGSGLTLSDVQVGNGQAADRTAEAFYTAPGVGVGPVATSIQSAAAQTAWILIPDYTAGLGSVMHTSSPKCGGVGAAYATDVYAATYFFGTLANPQNEILDTNSAYVSQSTSACGQPSTSSSQPVFAVAGPMVNEVVHYYESATSPLYYNSGTACIVRRDTSANVDCSTPTATNDVFLLEAFTDSAGRTVLIVYGRSWPGTLAGLEYLVNFILKNPSTYTSSWYVYRWQDATSGVSANSIPDPGDTYTQLAAGP